MDIALASIADYALVDQMGKMSVLGIFDILGAGQFPVAHPQLFVALRLSCRPIEFGTKHQITVRLQDEDGQVVIPEFRAEVQVPAPVVQNATSSFLQMVMGFSGIVFQKAGVFSFEIAIDGNHRHSLPLSVVQAQGVPQR